MYDQGHFCMLAFAQGTWKPQFKLKLIRKISDNFNFLKAPKTKEEEGIIGWNEVENSPLQNYKNFDKCKVCQKIGPIFKQKLGNNEGIILFSHNIPVIEDFQTFFYNIFRETGIKKVFYLEADIFNEQKLMRQREFAHQQIKSSDFFDLVRNEKFEQVTLYEISKYK